jgi:hypothetical protein
MMMGMWSKLSNAVLSMLAGALIGGLVGLILTGAMLVLNSACHILD